jgi:isocitrate dehydrogenase (NAD+)
LNKVNPLAMILSGVMMLKHLGEIEAVRRLETAVTRVIEEGRHVTYDMKPAPDDPTAATTSMVADAIIGKLI